MIRKFRRLTEIHRMLRGCFGEVSAAQCMGVGWMGGWRGGGWNFTLHEYRINYLPAPILLSLLPLSALRSCFQFWLLADVRSSSSERRKNSCETKEVKLIIKSMNIRKQEKVFYVFRGGRLMRKRSWLFSSWTLRTCAETFASTTRHPRPLRLSSTKRREKFLPLIN